MERIQNVMQRLQELYYSKHQKTGIDIDLMLDYTRVLYADLLEWRREFTDISPYRESVIESPSGQTAAEPAPPAEEPTVRPQAPDSKEEGTEQQGQEMPAGKTQREMPVPEVVLTQEREAVEAEHEAGDTTSETLHLPLEGEPVSLEETASDHQALPANEILASEAPEIPALEVLQQNATGISFEPPPPANPVKPEAWEDTEPKRSGPAAEEADGLLPVEPPAEHLPVSDISVPVPDTLPEPQTGMAYKEPDSSRTVEVPNRAYSLFDKPARDIRSVIGINDKYLFLNELFNNQKNDYETTLDRINNMHSYREATDWITAEIAPRYRWEKTDVTVESFYSSLEKHFSDR